MKKTLRATRPHKLCGEAGFVKGSGAEGRDKVHGFSRVTSLPSPVALDTRGHSTARWHASGVLAPLDARGWAVRPDMRMAPQAPPRPLTCGACSFSDADSEAAGTRPFIPFLAYLRSYYCKAVFGVPSAIFPGAQGAFRNWREGAIKDDRDSDNEI